MSVERKAHLIFIPLPVLSHLVAAVKTAELLAERDERLSVTVLIMKLPTDTKISSYTKNSPRSRINIVHLPENDPSNFAEMMKSPKNAILRFIDRQKGPVKDAISKIITEPSKLAGIVIDMFCTAMIDVANELGAPTYVVFTCGAAALGLMLHLQGLRDDHNQDLSEYEGSDFAVSIPTYVNPVPARVWPDPIFDKEGSFFDIIRRFREAKGIIVNTFLEFETHAIESLLNDEKIPTVYPVGPIIQAGGEGEDQESDLNKQKNGEIMKWLDEQPDSSVVFLCFGSNGCFDIDQVTEIALALERSRHRFLWSLRKPQPKEKLEFPGEYDNPGEILPEGFLDRTAGIGKVIGWAPQMAVLSHRAVEGFVSHCGWNSTLESVWCGVPMAVWPLAAEQQANAFQLVQEFGMAVEIKMDYRKNTNVIVVAETIERAIRQLMDPESEGRDKVKVLREKSRKVLMEGESSYDSLGRLVVDVMANVS